MNSEIKTQFELALKAVKTLPEKPSNQVLLALYALKKQAEIGDINIDAPDVFDYVGQAKYKAWEELQGMNCGEAMSRYIEMAAKLKTGELG